MSTCCKREGFSVEEGSGGMPTAFCAALDERRRPDHRHVCRIRRRARQLPGRRRPSSGPAPGLSEHAGGHTDPHSALGIVQPRRAARHQGGDAAARHHGHAALHRRAGREGARLEADPCREGLLRRARRHDLLPSLLHAAALQHGALGHALRRGLCDDLPLRLRRSRKTGAAATARRSRSRIRRCARRAPTTR